MAGTPRFKVHDQDKRYVAATVDAYLAAALVGAAGGDGWTVKYDGKIIWREGTETIHAGESADTAAQTMHERIRLAWQRESLRYAAQVGDAHA